MSVRKRTWKTTAGEAKEVWVVDYVDQGGKRRLKTFKRKKEADAYEARTMVDIGEGVHTADSASITIASASELWLATCRGRGLERSTITFYEQTVRLHIVPALGNFKLSRLTAPLVREFEDRMREGGTSPAMMHKIRTNLGAILSDAQERGFVARNVAKDLKARRMSGVDRRADKRAKGRLKVGVDIPSRQEIKDLVASLRGRWRPILITAISESGERHVSLAPIVVNTLREWRLACPKGGLVFPNGAGKVESHPNILQRGLIPAMLAAGIVKPDGSAKYTGLHALRHFYASWCVNSREDGGLGLSAKAAQSRLGHSTIAMTLDTYGHLFPRGDDGSELAAAEQSLLG